MTRTHPLSELLGLLTDALTLRALGRHELDAPSESATGSVADAIERRLRAAVDWLAQPPAALSADQLVDEHGEVCVMLADGCRLYSGWCDHDDPDARISGDYLRLEAPNGDQILYYDADEIVSDPYEGRVALGALVNAMAGSRLPPPGGSHE